MRGLGRRKAILSSYNKEAKALFGIDPATKYKVSFAVLFQLVSLHLLQGAPWYAWVFCCYTLSGVVNHSMQLAVHELSHNMGARSLFFNKALSILANLPMGIPAAISFKRYHAEHHKYLGEHYVDVDVPTYWEGLFFKNSTPRKILWMFLQPAFYSIRPFYLDPREPCLWEYINIACCIVFDLTIAYFYGLQGAAYLIMGSLLGMGVHPAAGHFIAEHYIMNKDQETYSYYGPMNWISYNSGYHIEHHDLPHVPCQNLPKLRKIAPEFYDNLPQYHSWTKVMYDYVVDPKLSPFSRIQRVTATHSEIEALRARGGLVKCDKFL